MTRSLLGITILGAVAVLTGCPIYPDSGNYRVCTGGRCYDCPDNTYSEACVGWTCTSDVECGGGYVCSGNECVVNRNNVDASTPAGRDASAPSARCAAPYQCPAGTVCGSDSICHAGDCAVWRCVSPYSCVVSFGQASCVLAAPGDGGSPGVDDAPPDASFVTDSPDAIPDATFKDAENAGDGAGDGPSGSDTGAGDAALGDADARSAPASVVCNADGQCGGGGSRCVNGVCTAQASLCSDATQCSAAQACVDGECTPRCSSAAPCPIGFDCDLTRGVCSENPAVCVGSSDCQGGKVCVESHCVAPCAPDDSGVARCPGAEICISGGCIPNQAASFKCKNDGYTGLVANACDPGNVCLHGDCYLGCALDSGACGPGDMCKQVTTGQGTFAVCAPPTELGSDCDPAAGTFCRAGFLCIDGYCK